MGAQSFVPRSLTSVVRRMAAAVDMLTTYSRPRWKISTRSSSAGLVQRMKDQGAFDDVRGDLRDAKALDLIVDQASVQE